MPISLSMKRSEIAIVMAAVNIGTIKSGSRSLMMKRVDPVLYEPAAAEDSI